MENSFQTSFIPKKISISNATTATKRREPKSLLSIISTFLFIISILASAGLFGYKIYLEKQKESLSISLSANRNNFEKEVIDELELFDKRTQYAQQLLKNHIVLSPMFDLLGKITIPSIQYIKFEQRTDETGFVVEMKGLARDYRSIALQASVFNEVENNSFKNVLFSNLVKDKNNNIGFNLKFNVDPSLLSYEKNNLEQKTLNNYIPPSNEIIPLPEEPTINNPLPEESNVDQTQL